MFLPAVKMDPETLIREMKLNGENLERRLDFVGFRQEDLRRISVLKNLMNENAQSLTSCFFDFLDSLGEAKALFADPGLMAKARLFKAAHLRAMVGGEYGHDYAAQRVKLALLYAGVNLDPRVFLGAYHNLLRRLGQMLMLRYEIAPLDGFEVFMSLKKIAFFDIGIFIDVLIFERERVIRYQHEVILELSTPLAQPAGQLPKPESYCEN